MFVELVKAFGLIFVAEMGDKTQILAMAFATRYKVKMVLVGIFLGSLLNHGLAVILGSYLSNFIPIATMQMVAGFAFVAFALWSLQMEEDEDEEDKPKKAWGPVMTVAMAFFIGELGDKTQLTAITLSAEGNYPVFILMGTVLGMIVTGGLGIYVGKKIGDKIPEIAIKFIAASIFMFFGITKLYSTVPGAYTTPLYTIGFLMVVGIIALIRVRKLLLLRKEEKGTRYKNTSERLRVYYEQMGQGITHICLGEKYCGSCRQEGCIVGHTKRLIKQTDSNNDDVVITYGDKKVEVIREAKEERVLEALATTLKILSRDGVKESELPNIRKIRHNFETILWGRSIPEYINQEIYMKHLKKLNQSAVCQIEKAMENL